MEPTQLTPEQLHSENYALRRQLEAYQLAENVRDYLTSGYHLQRLEHSEPNLYAGLLAAMEWSRSDQTWIHETAHDLRDANLRIFIEQQMETGRY